MFTFQYTRGLSYARGTSIDPHLSAEDRQVLYEKWDTAWGHPLEFSGGEKDITCEMVIEAQAEFPVAFRKVLGEKLSARILQAAKTHGG